MGCYYEAHFVDWIGVEIVLAGRIDHGAGVVSALENCDFEKKVVLIELTISCLIKEPSEI